MTVLWGSYKTVKCKNCTLFYHPRPLPSPKLLSCCQGLWDMRVLFHQPCLARKRQVLQLTGGSVWGRSSGGEPHTPGQASSLRFSCSLCGSRPQETWRSKVRKHTRNRLFQPLLHCLFRVFTIYVSVYSLCSTTCQLVSKKEKPSCQVEGPACEINISSLDLPCRQSEDTKTNTFYFCGSKVQ